MYPNPLLENIFGTTGCLLWTIQLLPQISKSYRTKSTEGLSPWLMVIWAISSVFSGTYVVVRNLNIPLVVQPQCFGVLGLLSWAQGLYYGEKRMPFGKVVGRLGVAYVCFAGSELGSIYALKAGIKQGTDLPVVVYGYIAAVLCAAGMFPQYYEIWKYKEVKGISMLFMAVDISGGVACLLSLIFKDHFDALASASYILVILLDSIVVLLTLLLNPRARRRRAHEAALRELDDAFASSPTSTTLYNGRRPWEKDEMFVGLDRWIAEKEKGSLGEVEVSVRVV